MLLQPPNRNAAMLDTVRVWADPRSLATTWGISFDFFSSGYLDGSVHPVLLPSPMNSVTDVMRLS